MYLISYDIEKDRIRNKIAKELENYGTRVQYSVFECRITEKLYKELYAKLIDLMKDEKTGNIRIYNICAKCTGRITTIGVKEEPYTFEIEDFFII